MLNLKKYVADIEPVKCDETLVGLSVETYALSIEQARRRIKAILNDKFKLTYIKRMNKGEWDNV